MNSPRGLFRLWIVGSALFVLAVASLNYTDIKEEFEDAASAILQPVTDQAVISIGRKRVTDPALIKRLERTPDPWLSLGWVAGFAFGIPLVVLILGSSLVSLPSRP